MAQFEDYLEKQRKGHSEAFRIDEYQKRLMPKDDDDLIEQVPQGAAFDFEFDPGQLEEKYQNRFRDSSYQERTMYYFQDEGLYAAKARRYWILGKKENNVEMERYAAQYTHHSASKRKKAANAAGNAFGKAALLVQENHIKEKKAKNDYEIFELREAVMRLRMEGMGKAAEAKSRNADHETYLKCKTKISCLLILQDQLRNLRKNAKRFNDQRVLQKFAEKTNALRAELENAKRKMSTINRNADALWAQENSIPEKTRNLMAGQNAEQMTEDQAKALAVLQTIHEKNQEHPSPCYSLRLDRNGQPMNKAELQKMDWIQKNKKVMQGNDQEAKDQMLLEVAKRVESYKLPDVTAFQNGSVLELFCQHGVEFYEMLLKTPDFLNEQMGQNEALAQYAQQHPVFTAKLKLLTSMGRHLRDTLKENRIDPDQASLFKEAVLEEEGDVDQQQKIVGDDAKTGQHPEIGPDERRQKIAADYQAYQNAIQDQNVKEEEVEQLSLQSEAEKNAEYATFLQKNPGFTKEQYRVYKELKASSEIFEKQSTKNRLAAINQRDNSTLEASRDLGLVLRSVHYDKQGNPISEEDRRREKQNQRALKAWEDKDEKTQRALVMKELPHLFDGFDPPTPENEELWFKKNIEERPFEFQELITHTLSISNMEPKFPWIREYINTHPAFAMKLHLMSTLFTVYPPFIRGFYQLNSNAAMSIEERESRQDAIDGMADFQQTFRDSLEGYRTQYELNRQSWEQMEQQKQDFRRKNPELTDWEYDMMQSLTMSYAVAGKENYKNQIAIAQQNREDRQGKEKIDQKNLSEAAQKPYDITRDAGSVLRSVLYNKEGLPLTEKDGELEKQNNRWMDAWENGDEETKKKMALDIVPHIFDEFELPEPKNLWIWVDAQMRTRPFAFMDVLRRTTNLHDLMNRIPAVGEYVLGNPVFNQKHLLFSCINNYINNYFGIHNIRNDQGVFTIRTGHRDYEVRKSFFDALDNGAVEYEMLYKEYKSAVQQQNQIPGENP